MLARSVLAGSLAMTLFPAFAPARPLPFGGHHAPPPNGGTWGGGGDTVPPPKPSTPTPKAAPSGPKSGEAPAPSGPKGAPVAGHAPSAPQAPLGATTPQPAGGAGALTGGDDAAFEASWNVWWFFHQDEFLHYASGPTTSDLRLLDQPATRQASDEAVVRSIAAVIERERSTEILTGALLGVARVHQPDALLAIRAGLASSTMRVREVSLVALGASGDESVLGDLESLLRDDAQGRKLSGERGQGTSQRMRAYAAYGLGLAAENSSSGRVRQMAARALSDVLSRDRSASADLQSACALALGLVPLPAMPGLAREKDDATPWVSRERMADFLAELLADKDRPEVLRAQLPCVLARLVADADNPTRTAAAQAIVTQLQRGSAVSGGLREGCIQALGELARPVRGAVDLKVQNALVQAAERGPEAERCFAWMALASVAAREGDGESPATERGVLRMRLVQALASVRSHERSWIALALGVLESRRARAGDLEPSLEVRAALRTAFGRASGPEEEAAIAMGIGLCGDLEGTTLVAERLQRNSQSHLVGYEVLALGLAHDASQRGRLEKLLETSNDPVVVEHAAEALGLIGDENLTRLLLAGAQSNASLEARESHVLALADVGDRSALALLAKKLADENQPPCMRAALSGALGGICDHDGRKWYAGLRTLANWRVASLTLVTGDGAGVLEMG
ncbi:MAG: HEAT repeat domain-containing protein [Planctomycetes bacterium]|nr:HEAT repeat domain-containing protein [Planctomycetota bacterium]